MQIQSYGEVKRGVIRGVTFILSIFEVHLEVNQVIGTKVGGAIVVARSILDVHEWIIGGVTFVHFTFIEAH